MPSLKKKKQYFGLAMIYYIYPSGIKIRWYQSKTGLHMYIVWPDYIGEPSGQRQINEATMWKGYGQDRFINSLLNNF